MKKMWRIYKIELLAIKGNGTELAVGMWMNLESVIHSELSQEKISYSNTHTRIYMDSETMVLMNPFAGQE